MDTRLPLRELIRKEKKRKAAERLVGLLIEGAHVRSPNWLAPIGARSVKKF
jgi:hypothetical protein